MESETTSILVQGGAVGLCLACIFVIYKITNGQRKSFIDALDRNTTALIKFSDALGNLTGSIQTRNKRKSDR